MFRQACSLNHIDSSTYSILTPSTGSPSLRAPVAMSVILPFCVTLPAPIRAGKGRSVGVGSQPTKTKLARSTRKVNVYQITQVFGATYRTLGLGPSKVPVHEGLIHSARSRARLALCTAGYPI